MAAGRKAHRAVHIVDDDAQVRRAVWFMLESAGYAPRVFACGEDFLSELDYLPLAPALVDLRMPDLDGFQLLTQIKQRAPAIPVVMLTGHGDIACAVRAMKLGALDFLEKPFDDHVLLNTIESASATMAQTVEQEEQQLDAARRIADLSRREQEVLACLVAGKSNKVIAFDLGLSIRTVEMHRVRMMRRLGVRTLPEALRVAHLGGMTAETPSRRPPDRARAAG